MNDVRFVTGGGVLGLGVPCQNIPGAACNLAVTVNSPTKWLDTYGGNPPENVVPSTYDSRIS